MKRVLTVLLAVLIAAIAFTGCASGREPQLTSSATPPGSAAPEDSAAPPAFTVDAIGVTYVKSPLNVPSIIEKDQGIFAQAFAEYGIGVEYSNLTTGPEQTQALASGDIQFLYAVGATSVILSAANGADIKIINTYSRSPAAFRLFAGPDSTIASAADLAGKKIAGPKGTILHELLVAYLATADLTEADVEFLSMGIPDAQAALAGNTVDCALLAGPAAYNMAKDGFSVVTTGEGLVDATIVVATSGDFAAKNPLLVQRFIEAQAQVLQYIADNHDEVMTTTAQETELSPEAVLEMYPMYDFTIAITPADIESMKRTEQFMFDNQMIETRVDIDSLILQVQ